MRLINADVLKQHIDKLPALPDGNFAGNHSALKALINMQPTVDAVPVKHGRWIKKRYWSEGVGMGERYGYYYSCSKCGNLVCGGYDECGKKYCDECGARMDGKEGDND